MLSACICTHNPATQIFSRCLDALRKQQVCGFELEILIVDNCSSPPVSGSRIDLEGFKWPVRIVREERLGLTQARLRALAESRGEILVFIDDDNLLAPDYLQEVYRCFQARPKAGAIGGRNLPLADGSIPDWFDAEMLSFLACIDRGNEPMLLLDEKTPLGAGMAIRKEAFAGVSRTPFILGDRVGKRLSSGGDTELCYRIRNAGWENWYEPTLTLQHYLPAQRLTLKYLKALNESFGRDRPYIEFFWYPGTWKRRAAYIWRSVCDAQRSITLGSSKGNTGNADARRILSAAFHRGRSRTLLKLAFGPDIWRAVTPLNNSIQPRERLPFRVDL